MTSLLATGVLSISFTPFPTFPSAFPAGVLAEAPSVCASSSAAGGLACFFSSGNPAVGVLEKNPRIDLWFLDVEGAAELPCFLAGAGREGVVVGFSDFAMMKFWFGCSKQ